MYDCGRCERTLMTRGLWPDNAEAWRVYQTLCGRTVRECELHAWVLEAWFREEPSFQARVTLLKRLDLIGSVFAEANDGRGTEHG